MKNSKVKILIEFLKSKNWWKIILAFIVGAVTLSGFSISFGEFKCQKQEIRIPFPGVTDETEKCRPERCERDRFVPTIHDKEKIYE